MQTFYSIYEFTEDNADEKYFNIRNNNTIKCKKVVTVEKFENGGSYICADKHFIFQKNNCLLYSFKVDYTWSFDDNIASKYGCIVRTFIPSMEYNNVVKRPSNVLFYNSGLGKIDEILPEGWRFRRLSSLLREFNEEYQVIDVLKINIDFGEWDAFESMFADQLLFFVKQIIFESHTEEILDRRTSLKSFLRFLNIWKTLYNLGFRQWRYDNQSMGYHKHIQYSSSRSCCALHYLINIHYL